MPDPLRPLRRLTDSRIITRAAAHLMVVGLVAVAVVVGVSQAQVTAAGQPGASELFGLVSTARAGGADPAPSRGVSFELSPQPLDEPEFVTRGAPAALPSESPKPTPAPVDPNATPLPAPVTAAIGATERSGQAVATVAAASNGALAWPVPGGIITQYFSAGHLAVDVANSAGSTVVAAEAGVVTWAGWRNNGGGLVISIDHGNGMVTLYNHLGSIWVGVGQSVARGQAIAGVGCTGICTGPHVHFEVIVNGAIQNPLRYL